MGSQAMLVQRISRLFRPDRNPSLPATADCRDGGILSARTFALLPEGEADRGPFFGRILINHI
jgi:hypothetical protein